MTPKNIDQKPNFRWKTEPLACDYRWMLPRLPAFCPSREALDKLALIMSGRSKFPDREAYNQFLKDVHVPFARIPSGYTYLGQFIAHDITFDEASDRHEALDFPWDTVAREDLITLRNRRTPLFDLETIYGHENPKNRGEIRRSELMLKNYRLPFLKIGHTKGFDRGTAGLSFPCDLPRGVASVDAKVVDLRNDENLIVAQLQVLFMKFHNALVLSLSKAGDFSYSELFDRARKMAIRYYQTIVLTDFLPRIVDWEVLKETVAAVRKENPSPDDAYMPLEFSVGAFRYAHSMIRNKYNLNDVNDDTSLDELMRFTGRGAMNSSGLPGPVTVRLSLPSVWIIDWNRFFDLGDAAKLNFAERIDTQISSALLQMRPKPLFKSGGRSSAVALLDLYRGRRFGLPSGQDVANAFGYLVIEPDRLAGLIWSKNVEDLPSDEADTLKEDLYETFAESTPLWFYILAEAESTLFGNLGKTGSRIVAETIVGLIYRSDDSILRQEWEKNNGFDDGFLLTDWISADGEAPYEKRFTMPDMLRFIDRSCRENFRELYPRRYYPEVKGEFDELNPLGSGYLTD